MVSGEVFCCASLGNWDRAQLSCWYQLQKHCWSLPRLYDSPCLKIEKKTPEKHPFWSGGTAWILWSCREQTLIAHTGYCTNQTAHHSLLDANPDSEGSRSETKAELSAITKWSKKGSQRLVEVLPVPQPSFWNQCAIQRASAPRIRDILICRTPKIESSSLKKLLF